MPRIDIAALPRYEKKRSIILTITRDCNLRCSYCYEPTKSRNYMEVSTAKQAIIDFMEEQNTLDRVEFQFFGGEPLLHFDLIREVVEWFHTIEWRKKHLFFIGTNGTLLTEQIKNWLIKYSKCVWVGVSLDGGKIAHDLSRCNSYDAVIEAYSFLRKYYPTQPVKMTIGKDTIPFVADGIIDMEEKEILFTANIVFEDVWGTSYEKANLLNKYMHQLKILVDYYVERPELFPPRIISHDLSGLIIDNELLGKSIVKRWCGTGREMTMVDVDGTRYPCQRFSPWVTNRIDSPNKIQNELINWKPDSCKYCRLIFMCPTCAGYNWEKNGDVDFRTMSHCEFFKMEIMASCLYFTKMLVSSSSKEYVNSRYTLDQKKRIIDAIIYVESNGI